MPYSSVYGSWPRSGEIDLTEVHGNRNIMNWGTNVGINQTTSDLHFGPRADCNGFMKTLKIKNSNVGLNENFNNFKVVWTSSDMKFYLNDVIYGTVNPSYYCNSIFYHHNFFKYFLLANGFWSLGNFSCPGLTNPWINSPNLMAPFDQEFFVIMNLAIGGTNYFSDSYTYSPYSKPW